MSRRKLAEEYNLLNGVGKGYQELQRNIPVDMIGLEPISEKPKSGHVCGSTAWYTSEQPEGYGLVQIRRDYLVSDPQKSLKVIVAFSPTVPITEDTNDLIPSDSQSEALDRIVVDHLKKHDLKSEGWINLEPYENLTIPKG